MAKFVVNARVVVYFTRTVEVDGTESPIDTRVLGAAEAAATAIGRRIPDALDSIGADFVGIDGDATITLIEEPRPEEKSE